MPPGPLLAEAEKREDSEESFFFSSPSSSDDEDDRVQSKLGDGAFGSMDSLEDSLPIKRGLSNWFRGKSKSFASLEEAAALSSAKEMAKEENPFNKRRRVLLNCKGCWQRRPSCAALNEPSLCTLTEEKSERGDDEDEDDNEEDEATERRPPPRKIIGSFRSPRSFSLSDLHRAQFAQF